MGLTDGRRYYFMNKMYDLTDKKTLSKTIDNLVATHPLLNIGKTLIDKVFSKDTIEVQNITAKELIEEGRRNGVDEMEIIIDNSRGMKFDVPLEEGERINTMVGADEKLHIKIKFKPEKVADDNTKAQVSKTWFFWVMGGIILALAVGLVIALL